MDNPHYDVIVVGLGIMGASALYQAAKRGAKVLGIDRFSPPHTYGSSHGDTRVTRQAIGEGEMYMPFIRRTNEIWAELEAATNRRLYLKTGGLIVSPIEDSAHFHANNDFVATTEKIAKAYSIDHRVLSAEETMQAYPLLKMRPQDHTYVESGAGVLRPELCIQTLHEQATELGVTIHTGEKVIEYDALTDSVSVQTEKDTYQADKLILAMGAWMPNFLPEDYSRHIEIYRQVIYWFEAENINDFMEDNCPFVIWIGDQMEDFFTVFPTPRDGIQGVKVLTEQYRETTSPDELDRVVKPEEIAHMARMTQERLHGVKNKLVHADVCMYAVTPDEHFVIDFHPDSEHVIVASPCSGHGFKHAAAIGETLAEMALTDKSTIDISKFSLERFRKQEG